jgi:hypothetical protein
MDDSKRYVARLKFKLEVFESKATAFQDLFSRVMTKAFHDFQIVHTQGRKGDQKNDGFIPSKGIYYQVYAPEKPEKSTKKAIEKLETDFNGLVKLWNKETPVKEFYFVLNDEYRGNYPDIHHAVASLQKTNKDTKIGLFLPKDIEDIFLSLPEEKIQDIIGYLPGDGGLEGVDYDVLTEVVTYLLKNVKSIPDDGSLEVPNFDDKIRFNKLSGNISALLTTANFQASVLYDFFQNNSGFCRKDLRDKFSVLYKESLAEIPDYASSKNDLVFFDILRKSTPQKTKNAQDAVLVLMSYFFESCDIFEEPKNI